jgi:alcohol dehydrogenase
MIPAFVARPSPKLVFGPGTLRELPALVREVGGTSVLLVTDTGLIRAGHPGSAERLLRDAAIPVVTYDHSHENPTEADAAACADFARAQRFDCIVALGGGSSMDTAKAANFLLTNGGRMRDYQGWAKATKPMHPLIAIPTTSGTGSECQSYALVSRDDTHEKMACGDPKAKARIAILDPELTATQPRAVAIQTGLDALTHAVESAVCTKRNVLSSLYAEAAFQHLASAIERIIAGKPTPDDRAAMMTGATLAGLAIENSMLGAAHATANPLTAHLGVTHGNAVALMLPHVIRFNSELPEVNALYARLGAALHATGVTTLPLIDWVESVVRQAAVPRPTLDGRVNLPTLATDAAKQWTGTFNPRPLQHDDFVALYRRALTA